MVANFLSIGTHCAGTVGGAEFGIAKAANIAGIKVLDKSGSGDTSTVISGINYAVRDCGSGKCVMSISIGGSKSAALNQAVNNAIQQGIPVSCSFTSQHLFELIAAAGFLAVLTF